MGNKKFQGNLIIFIVLILVCFPAGLIYLALNYKEMTNDNNTRTCMSCGAQIDTNYKLCPFCGKPVVVSYQQQTPSQQAPPQQP